MRVLALDQSSIENGWAVVEGTDTLVKYGSFRLDRRQALEERMAQMFIELECLITEWEPDMIAYEGISYQRNVNVFKVLAQVQMAVMMVSLNNGVKSVEVYPATWRSKTGVKARTRDLQKAEAIDKVEELYGVRLPEDVAEAVLIGLSCL